MCVDHHLGFSKLRIRIFGMLVSVVGLRVEGVHVYPTRLMASPAVACYGCLLCAAQENGGDQDVRFRAI